MQEEYKSLLENKAWVLVDLPQGQKIVEKDRCNLYSRTMIQNCVPVIQPCTFYRYIQKSGTAAAKFCENLFEEESSSMFTS
jgi:hypothetical protein